MKSLLGLFAALVAAILFGLAAWLAFRPGAGWLDGQWLFVVALPYNEALLATVGETNFTPDSNAGLAAVLLFDVALAYVAGAVVEATARGLWRLTRRARARA